MQNPVVITSPNANTANFDNSWKAILSDAFRDPEKLLEYLYLNQDKYLSQLDRDSRLRMLVPLSYAKKMVTGDWHDPLLRQVLPVTDEKLKTPGFVVDPVADLSAEISPGLLQKYQGRVLLVTTGACAVHCRYCFRREFPYSDSTPGFLSWIDALDIQKVMVIHANHANELDEKVGIGLKALRNKGVTLLNQAVLLKGINDSVESLSDLSQGLFSFQVLPYYLHQLDRVQGAAHFEVDRNKAIDLLKSLRNQLPGYLIPRLVEEISGKRSKQAIV